MANPDFSAVLNRPASSAEKPKPLPVGEYLWLVTGLPKQDKSSKKGTPFVEFTCKPLQAGEDVDTEALEAMGGFGNKTQRNTFYLTEDALWRLTKFLGDLGIAEQDDQGEDKSFSQMIDESPNRQFWGTLKHQPSDDGESVFAQFASTRAVEE